MKKIILTALLLSTSLLSLSCASYFKRKECEKTNWYEHGQKVAMQGKRPDADNYVNECKQVEANINWADLDVGFKAGMANYCKPNTVLATGKKGEFFNENLCDFDQLRKLKVKHAEGVKHFCRASNGKRFGASGKKYNDICPEKMEEAFMAQYRIGRKKYLGLEIKQSRREIRSLEGKIRSKERQVNQLQKRLSVLPIVGAITRTRVRNPRTGRMEVKKDEEQERRRNNLNYKINQANRDIDRMRGQQDNLRAQIDEYEIEMNSL